MQIFVFLWYNTTYLQSYQCKFLCFYGMTWHTLVIMVQNVCFLWHDMTYLNDNGTKFCVLWYDTTHLHDNSEKCCVFMVFLNEYSAKFVFYGMIWHILMIMVQNLHFYGMMQHTLMIMVQSLCAVVIFAYFRLSS